MSEKTSIEWTDATFNPWWGCSNVSPGCDNCYAENIARRFGTIWGVDAARREFGDKHWHAPVAWNKRAAAADTRLRVFCASMADVFDKNAPAGARERLWDLIAATPSLDWQLLTKRIGNVERMVPSNWMTGAWPANAWIGATVVNQEEADRDLVKLLCLPARVRFVSFEPLLGPVNASLWLESQSGIQWAIVGGESGPRARPAQVDWIRSLMEQCRAADVPCLVKQLGAEVLDHGMSGPGQHWPPGTARENVARIGSDDPGFAIHLKHRKGGDWQEWPEDLHVREFP